MKDDVIEMYKEGFTTKEIAEETSLAIGTVGAYIYSTGINKNPQIREVHLRMKIRKMISEYEAEFKEKFV